MFILQPSSTEIAQPLLASMTALIGCMKGSTAPVCTNSLTEIVSINVSPIAAQHAPITLLLQPANWRMLLWELASNHSRIGGLLVQAVRCPGV